MTNHEFQEKSEQKSRRAADLVTKVDRCLRRCDSDLERFGNEIESEQPGITAQLEENALHLEPDKNQLFTMFKTCWSSPKQFEWVQNSFGSIEGQGISLFF